MNIQLFAAVWISVLILGVKITQAVREHVHVKDVTKALEEDRRVSEEKRREAEAREHAAEMEKIAAETKAALANKIAAMNEEQLAAYNRTLQQPVRQYVPVPMLPIISQYPPAVVYYDSSQVSLSQIMAGGLHGRWP